MRDAVLASVSHDLQNPITAAKGNLQILQRRLARDPNTPALALEPGLKQAERAVVRMQVMVRELVDAARLGAGHDLTLVLRPTDLIGLVREVVEEQAAAADGHELVVESHRSEIQVSCDSERLARVLANLLSNALKYSPAGSTVLVRVTAEDHAEGAWATTTISDRGIGIPSADLPHVFERFQRARNVSGSVMGAGLGLAGARMIVEQHGGTLDIFSIEGVGTTVVVRLPCGPLPEHQEVFPHIVAHPNFALHRAV